MFRFKDIFVLVRPTWFVPLDCVTDLIKIDPSLLLKTKRVQFSLLGKVGLTRKRRTTMYFEQHLLTKLHVFQNLRESHNRKNRTIKINISIQIYNQKCNLLYHGFPTKSMA